MAYLLQTELAAIQTSTTETELRKKTHGVIPFAFDQTPSMPALTSEVKAAIEMANGRYVDISALKEMTPDITRSFTYDITPNLSESDKTRVTVYTVMSSFQYNPYTFLNNAAGAEEYKINKLKEIDKAIASDVSTTLLSILDARKTQVLDVTGAPTGVLFNASDYVTMTEAVQAKPFFDYLETIMMQNNLNGEYSAVGTHSLRHILADIKQYGSSNDKNLLAQSFPTTYFESNLAVTASSNATAYMVKDGAIGIQQTYPAIFVANESRIPGIEFSIGAQPLPQTGMKPLIMKQTQAYDETALSSHQAAGMSLVENYKVGVSFAVVSTYNSDITTRVNDVVKLELLDS